MDNKQKLRHARIALQFLQGAIADLSAAQGVVGDPDFGLWRAGEELKLINGADDDFSATDEKLINAALNG
jgi:hypothetical protein